MFPSIYTLEVHRYSTQECFVASGDSLAQIGNESRKESYSRAAVGAPETDFLLAPFLNPGICCDGLEDTALL